MNVNRKKRIVGEVSSGTAKDQKKSKKSKNTIKGRLANSVTTVRK